MVRHWKGISFEFGACNFHYQWVKECIVDLLNKAEAYERLNNFQNNKDEPPY